MLWARVRTASMRQSSEISTTYELLQTFKYLILKYPCNPSLSHAASLEYKIVDKTRFSIFPKSNTFALYIPKLNALQNTHFLCLIDVFLILQNIKGSHYNFRNEEKARVSFSEPGHAVYYKL